MTYIVMTSSCRSPAGSKWRGYRNLAIVELEPGFAGTPKMISERARGVRRIVDYVHSVFVGRERGYGVEKLAEFERRATELNEGAF